MISHPEACGSAPTGPTASLEQEFAARRANSVRVSAELAAVRLDVEFRYDQPAEQVFCGIADERLEHGVAFSVHLRTGEVVDEINHQGIIGYLDRAPIPEGRLTPLFVQIDKFGRNLISTIELGNERLLYPAVHLDDDTNHLYSFLGCPRGTPGAIKFGHAHLRAQAR